MFISNLFLTPVLLKIIVSPMDLLVLILGLRLIFKKSFSNAINTVLCVYFFAQIPMTLSETLKYYSESNAVYLLTTVVSCGVFYAIISVFFGKYIRIFLNSNLKKTAMFTLIPLSYILLEYSTVIFPNLILSETRIAIRFMPPLAAIIFFYFIILFAKEITEEKKQLGALTREAIDALSAAVEVKDIYTNGHSQRVADYSCEIARRLGLTEFQITEIYYAGLLHDVGKIGIDDNIINKNGKLSDVEYQVMKNHPRLGFKMLDKMSKNTDLKNLAAGALSHHERVDGKGYPNGTKGEDIPYYARIIAVADAYDAMTSYRSYRNAMPQESARTEILKGLGSQFDPEIGKIMIQMIDEDKNYTMREHSEDPFIDMELEPVEDLREIG